MKIRLRLIRARSTFYMISDNPNASLGIVDCSLYTRRIARKDDYHKKKMDMLAYAPVEYNCLESLAKTFIIPARQNHFIQENFFNNAPIRRVTILPSLVFLLITHSGINNLISVKLEYSEGANQM